MKQETQVITYANARYTLRLIELIERLGVDEAVTEAHWTLKSFGSVRVLRYGSEATFVEAKQAAQDALEVYHAQRWQAKGRAA